jgi:hypothetical protein
VFAEDARQWTERSPLPGGDVEEPDEAQLVMRRASGRRDGAEVPVLPGTRQVEELLMVLTRLREDGPGLKDPSGGGAPASTASMSWTNPSTVRSSGSPPTATSTCGPIDGTLIQERSAANTQSSGTATWNIARAMPLSV